MEFLCEFNTPDSADSFLKYIRGANPDYFNWVYGIFSIIIKADDCFSNFTLKIIPEYLKNLRWKK